MLSLAVVVVGLASRAGYILSLSLSLTAPPAGRGGAAGRRARGLSHDDERDMAIEGNG